MHGAVDAVNNGSSGGGGGGGGGASRHAHVDFERLRRVAAAWEPYKRQLTERHQAAQDAKAARAEGAAQQARELRAARAAEAATASLAIPPADLAAGGWPIRDEIRSDPFPVVRDKFPVR